MKSASGGREQAMVNVRFREDLMGWATTVMAANRPVRFKYSISSFHQTRSRREDSQRL